MGKTIAAVVVVLSALGAALPAAQQSTGPWPLAAVRVEGLSRYASADIVRLSALEVGAPVVLADLQAAANRLMQTGLFRKLGIGYRVAGDGLSLTLQVEEASWSVPLVLDNLIWMPDAEFITRMTAHVPGFTGTVAEGGQANEFIAAAAQRVLAEAAITGRADLQPRVDLRTGATYYALVVLDTDRALRVCDVRLPGAAAIGERVLLDLTRDLVGRDYSRSALLAVVDGAVLQAYRERGHWAVRFHTPVVAPVEGRCDGLSVSVPVDEGPAYVFGGARWMGTPLLEPAALDRAIALPVGRTADARRVDAGLRALVALYRASGYLTANPTARPEFDEGTRQVTFLISPNPGPQFRLAAINTVGLNEREARDVTSRFRLAPGDVFDGAYYDRFVSEHTERRNGAFKADLQLDRQAGTATVTFSGS